MSWMSYDNQDSTLPSDVTTGGSGKVGSNGLGIQGITTAQ